MEVGIKFDKSNGIYSQLAKLQNGGDLLETPQARRKRAISDAKRAEDRREIPPEEELDPESHFHNLKSFYQSQIAESTQAGGLGYSGDYGFGSPGTLDRIMGLYTGTGLPDKKSKRKNDTFHEASKSVEGLQLFSPMKDEAIISNFRTEGWSSTLSVAQRAEQQVGTRSMQDVRPIPYILRSKRSKRCRTCRHILTKPESKLQHVRFRIRLVAINYIPSITIKPLLISPPAAALSNRASMPLSPPSNLLAPGKTTQHLLTFKNPLFDTVKVTLATPGKTPGRFGHKVTILCPQFEVGANVDMWDEALGAEGGDRGSSGSGSTGEKRRTRVETSEGQGIAEAGKVWEKGRNWCSVVIEVVPAWLKGDGTLLGKEEGDQQEELQEDEDVLEIPMFVRLEWEESAGHDDTSGGTGGKNKEAKEKRELAYWSVLGIARIARD